MWNHLFGMVWSMGVNMQMVVLAYDVIVFVFYRLWIRFDSIA
jgi:hypothetical protein